jgi:hypothetical protein
VRNGWIARFDDLTSVEASDTPTNVDADLVLTNTRLYEPYDVFIDANDDVWVADYDRECVFRFDASDVFDETEDLDVDEALELEYVSADTPAEYTITYPTSIWITDDGTLYVANAAYDDQVSRFDDAGSLVGNVRPEANAYLTVERDDAYASMVLVDDDGALWIAHDEGELFKIDDPTSYTGVANFRADASLALTWAEEGGPETYLDGGRQLFVPIPR